MLDSLNKVIMIGRVATPLKEIADEKIKRMGVAVETSGMLHHIVVSGDFCDDVARFEVGCGVYLEGRLATYPNEAEDGAKSTVFATTFDKISDAPKPKKTTRKKKVAKKEAK